jgi:high affinity Mn2+ porin
VNIEPALSSELGAFLRASVNDGSKEADEFTEINRSLSAGLSPQRDPWGRHNDGWHAAVANGLSGAARDCFVAG